MQSAPRLRPRALKLGARLGGRLAAVLVLGLVIWAGTAAADPAGQVTEFSAGLSVGSYPFAIGPGSDGNLWFTDEGGSVGRVTPSGQVTEFSFGLNQGSNPYAIAPGADGNLWFTDDGTTTAIGRITPSGQIAEFSAGLSSTSVLVGIAPGADGNLWFTDGGAGALGRITPAGQISEFSLGLNPGSYPWEIALGSDGSLWFTDEGTTSAVGRITPSGQIEEFATGGATKPYGIAPGPDGNLWFTDIGTGAIGRITPAGQITEFPGPTHPVGIAPGPDGNLWFTDIGTGAIGRITPSGQITEFSLGLNMGSVPEGIAPGADGNLWFTDDGTTKAIGRVGAGASPALAAAPTVAGPGRAGSPEICQGHWSSWAGISPSASLYAFDGYVWLRDGTPISGQTAQSYTPVSGEIGHQLACRVAVTYPLPFFVSASATSAAITVQQPTAPAPPTPVLSALRVTPRTFTLRRRRVGGHCVSATHGNRNHSRCTRRLALRIGYTLNVSATTTFTVKRRGGGRTVHGRCVKPTRKNARHRTCARFRRLPGRVVRSGTAGVNQFTFTGRIGGHRLGVGTYQLIAIPAGGTPKKVTFKIHEA